MQIEVNKNSVIRTPYGNRTIEDLLEEASSILILWAIPWEEFDGAVRHYVTFHNSLKDSKQFVKGHTRQDLHLDGSPKYYNRPSGPAILADVSDWIYNYVQEAGLFISKFEDIELAKTYNGD